MKGGKLLINYPATCRINLKQRFHEKLKNWCEKRDKGKQTERKRKEERNRIKD